MAGVINTANMMVKTRLAEETPGVEPKTPAPIILLEPKIAMEQYPQKTEALFARPSKDGLLKAGQDAQGKNIKDTEKSKAAVIKNITNISTSSSSGEQLPGEGRSIPTQVILPQPFKTFINRLSGKEIPREDATARREETASKTGESSMPITHHFKNMTLTKVKNLAQGKIRGLAAEREFDRYLISRNTIYSLTQPGDLSAREHNVFYINPQSGNQKPETKVVDSPSPADLVVRNPIKAQNSQVQNSALPKTSPAELISQFGNLIFDPNIPPSELINRYTGSMASGSTSSDSTDFRSIKEFVEKITLEEKRKVKELSQKLTEQEKAIYKLKHENTQLQEDLASGTNVKRITSMVMQELMSKFRLEKMRYGYNK